MLAPRVVIFTPSNLLGSSNNVAQAVSEALLEIERRNIPLVLSTHGTRAQLEALRRKIAHAHPFITEGGGGLFLPDGYFALRLEGAIRAARYLCVPFGRSSREAGAAAEEIARQAGGEIVRYPEMNVREIARNAGVSERDAQASREREFSERFFFAGNADLASQSFEKIAREQNWQIRRAEPFWELCSGNDEGKAVRYLMKLYRQALRSRIRSVGIGASFEDLSLLAASDQAFILPESGGRFDDQLLSKLPNSARITVPGPSGWNQIVLDVLSRVS
jgi:predicted mannosyl-3-phosphoglycerate phosphatase (HAD superfamily)